MLVRIQVGKSRTSLLAQHRQHTSVSRLLQLVYFFQQFGYYEQRPDQ